jgi:hypothetical protein
MGYWNLTNPRSLDSPMSGILDSSYSMLAVEDGEREMSYPLRSQISLWWQTVSSEETLNVYQNTVQVTWKILQETAKLLWLFLLLGLVFFDWFRDTAVNSGAQLKTWSDSLQEPKAEYAWAEVVKFAKSVGQNGTTRLLGQAREQLGLAVPAPSVATSPTISPASTVAAAKPVASPPSVTVSEETPVVPKVASEENT